MKPNNTTDTVQDIETKMQSELLIIKDPKVAIEIKKKAAKKVNFLMSHLKNVDDKEINGKTYPERMKGLPDDKPMDKKELLKLIDSVDEVADYDMSFKDNFKPDNLDGISPGKDTFVYQDKGWKEPKHPYLLKK